MNDIYKIGEAAALLDLKTYVLRFWETEFPDISPLRTDKGQRVYTSEHLALLERIRYLLHERGLTLEGARKVLEEEKNRGLRYEFGRPGALTNPDPLYEPTESSSDGAQMRPLPGSEALRNVFAASASQDTGADGDISSALPDFKKNDAPNALPLDREYAAGYAPKEVPRETANGSEPQNGVQSTLLAANQADNASVLPLSAVTRAAFLAGEAAGVAEPNGLPSEGGAVACPDRELCEHPASRHTENEASCVPTTMASTASASHVSGIQQDILRELAAELVSIADILRGKA